MDFKDHEQDHPSVERLPLVQSKPMMLMKKNYKCTSCNKKFKNETSLNYHSMFHTSEEKSPSIIEPPKYSKSLEKDAKIDIRSQNKTQNTSAMFVSSDSDSDDDSRHLSLKHISNSVKRHSTSSTVLKKLEIEVKAKPVSKIVVQKPETDIKKKVSKFECEKCKKKFKDPMTLEYHKITFHVEKSSPVSPSTKSTPIASSSDGEKAKKRKLQVKPKENLKKQNIVADSNKSKCLTGIFRKTQKYSEPSDDENPQHVIDSIKSTLSMMKQRKERDIYESSSSKKKYRTYSTDESDLSDSDAMDEVKQPKVKSKSSKNHKKRELKMNFKKHYDSSSEESSEEIDRKSLKRKSSSDKSIEKEFQNYSIDAILHSKDEDCKNSKKKNAKQIKRQRRPSMKVVKKTKKTVTSDSEPEIVKKEIKIEPIIELEDSEDESSKMREKIFESNSKEKCQNCNKSFKNELVLRYHQLHCEAPNKSTSKTYIERNILQIKKSSESPADKILKKFSKSKTEETTENDKTEKPKISEKIQEKVSKQSTDNPLLSPCNNDSPKIESRTMDVHVKESHNYKVYVSIKKLNKETTKKFNLDINEPKIKLKENEDVKGKLKPKESAKNTLQGKNKEKVILKSISKPKTKLKVAENLKLKEPKLKEKQGGKVKCPQCGKKYADSMALEYHKITFHVEEEETKLFSESIYHEQMSFDKNVLRLNESDVGQSRRNSITIEQNDIEKDISNEKRQKSEEKIEMTKIKKTNEVQKQKKDKIEILKHQNPIVENSKTSNNYCICDKPERDDMLG